MFLHILALLAISSILNAQANADLRITNDTKDNAIKTIYASFSTPSLLNNHLAINDSNELPQLSQPNLADIDTQPKPILKPHSTSFSIPSLYKNADMVVKSVIWILCLFSLLTWAVFLYKIWQFIGFFKILKNDNRAINSLDSIKSSVNLPAQSFATLFLEEITDEISQTKSKENPDSFALKKRLRIRLDNTINRFAQQSKSFITLLASVGSSAPFIGLFGTVWGIMNAFIGISQAKSASLAVVAPGIAEALFATAFGLVAAIPAVLFYNYLIRLSVRFSHKIDRLATRLYIIADRDISHTKF